MSPFQGEDGGSIPLTRSFQGLKKIVKIMREEF